MGDEREINLPLLDQAVNRILEVSGAPTLIKATMEGEEWVMIPRREALALCLASGSMLTLATLIPKQVKLSE